MIAVMDALAFYTANLFLRLTRPGPLAIVLSVVGFLSLCVAGWLGGKLMYRHRIGVSWLPTGVSGHLIATSD